MKFFFVILYFLLDFQSVSDIQIVIVQTMYLFHFQIYHTHVKVAAIKVARLPVILIFSLNFCSVSHLYACSERGQLQLRRRHFRRHLRINAR